MGHLAVSTAAFVTLALVATVAHADDRYFQIQVVDDQTGRGVPLVELRTVNEICYYTDSNGIVAFDEPGLMGQKVFVHVSSHGYEFPKDGFGYLGAALMVGPGGNATLKVKRLNIAERLYRITGSGIYRDSMLTGHAVPVQKPVLNGQVFGSDSVVNAHYQGRLFWIWGDTQRPSYPLGNFNVSAATSSLPSSGGLDPNVGVDLTYFVDERGFAKQMAKMPGRGPTWIDSLVTLKDADGRERLFAYYVKVEPPLTVYARGLAEFNDRIAQFEHVAEFDVKGPVVPSGHTFVHTENGVEYVYFCKPFPLVRVRAQIDDLKSTDRYEAYTCLAPGSSLDQPLIDRADDGTIRFGWKRQTPASGPDNQAKLLRAKLLTPAETPMLLRDQQSGETVKPHNGSVNWNEYRKRWIMIAAQAGGSSYLGEIWYADAEQLTGPWENAVKIVTHDKYSFYNPKQHPYFDQQGGRFIYFEGTYTRTFSGRQAEPTPRYDYNQIMYRLDLADPRLGGTK